MKELAKAQAHLSVKDKKIKKLIGLYGDCRIRPHTDYYSELVTSIVGQQLSTKAAAAIWQRLLGLSGGQPPSPRLLLQLSDEALRGVGLSRPKIGYIKDLASHIIDGRLDLEHIATLPNEEVTVQLTAVKGIGEWSAHMFLMFSLGRLDILPHGDLGIRKAAMQTYGLNGLPGKQELEGIASKNNWHPYESVACWYLWQSLDNTTTTSRRDGVSLKTP